MTHEASTLDRSIIVEPAEFDRAILCCSILGPPLKLRRLLELCSKLGNTIFPDVFGLGLSAGTAKPSVDHPSPGCHIRHSRPTALFASPRRLHASWRKRSLAVCFVLAEQKESSQVENLGNERSIIATDVNAERFVQRNERDVEEDSSEESSGEDCGCECNSPV